jgi:mannose-1-phosphate guanylyltransferase
MAGGRGQRLWPLSREKRPKQVLKLFDGKTLLRLCYERLAGLFGDDRILVLTNAAYVDTVRGNLPEVPAENVIGEPAVRDTSGAIGLAAAILAKKHGDASMAVVTADQVIEPVEPLRRALADALGFVEKNPGELVVFGIRPTFASTQLGYVQLGSLKEKAPGGSDILAVEKFREKPDENTAGQYLEAGNYAWNSGLFVWKAATILDYLSRFVPETAEPLRKIAEAWDTERRRDALEEHFVKLPKISIDYAVMERAENVSAIRLDCRWLDLGSFTALADVIKRDAGGNVIVAAQNALLDCKDNVVVTEDGGHLMAAIGLKDTVIVHGGDATLVCPADQAHRIKELLEKIEREGGGGYV